MQNNSFLSLTDNLNITFNEIKEKEQNGNDVLLVQMIEEREIIEVEHYELTFESEILHDNMTYLQPNTRKVLPTKPSLPLNMFLIQRLDKLVEGIIV